MRIRGLVSASIGLFALALSAAATLAADPPRWRPAPMLRWQMQFTGAIDLNVPADVFDLDLFETSAATVARLHRRGRRAVCYINAGAWENWRPDAADFPPAVRGKPLEGWPGERWFDIRRLDILAPLLRQRVALCRQRGFDGIEFDNVNGYTNDTGFPLTAADQLRFNRWLARVAHRAGLAVGLKNDLEQVRALEPDFDFAINESCWTFRECGLLRPFREAGKAVLVIEYEAAPAQFCPTVSALRFVGIRKNLELDAFVQRCPR
jgi:hypothetical protein